MAIDEGKLTAFMGQAVTDMSASVSSPLWQSGTNLGSTKQWQERAPSAQPRWPNGPAPMSATCANG